MSEEVAPTEEDWKAARDLAAKNRQAVVYAEAKQKEIAEEVFKTNVEIATNARKIDELQLVNKSLTNERDHATEKYEALTGCVWVLRQEESTEQEKAYARGMISRYTGVRHFR